MTRIFGAAGGYGYGNYCGGNNGRCDGLGTLITSFDSFVIDTDMAFPTIIYRNPYLISTTIVLRCQDIARSVVS